MPGARIEITQDTITPAVKAAESELLGNQFVELLLSDIGEYLVKSTRDRAARQIDPNGNPWRALSPSYKRWKSRKRPGKTILKFDDHMLGDQFVWQIEGGALYVGTNAKYGAAHQFGDEHEIAPRSQRMDPRKDRSNGDHAKWVTMPRYQVTLPARPFLGISTADEQRMITIGQRHLQTLFASPTT